MKIAIDVRADFSKEGLVIPLGFIDENLKTNVIDRVLEIDASNNHTKYKCRTKNNIINLIREGDIWFLSIPK